MRVLISIWIWITGTIYFVCFLIIALVCTFLFPERIYDPWLKKMMRFLFVLIGSRVEVEGLENLKPNTTYLFMANHLSLFDPPALFGFLPGIVRGVEAHGHHKWPLYGWVSRRLGNLPIERENIQSSVSSIRQTFLQLNNGRSMIILPEGHRSMDGEIKQFKKLPFFLARQIDKSIVPIGLSGLYQLKQKGTGLFSHPE